MMIILCESCDANFIVSANQIGLNGRFVRCSQCSHEWLAYAKEKDIKESLECNKITDNNIIMSDNKYKMSINSHFIILLSILNTVLFLLLLFSPAIKSSII